MISGPFHSCPPSILPLQDWSLKSPPFFLPTASFSYILGFSFLGFVSQVTFLHPFPVFQSRFSKLFPVSLKISPSTHFLLLVLPHCLFLPHRPQSENQEASTLFSVNDEMNMDTFFLFLMARILTTTTPAVLSSLIWLHTCFLFNFSSWPYIHLNTHWSFVFPFSSAAIFYRLCHKWTCFHRRPPLK